MKNPLILLLGMLAFVISGCASVRTVSVVENRSLSPRGLDHKGELVGTVKTEPFREAIVTGKETVDLIGY